MLYRQFRRMGKTPGASLTWAGKVMRSVNFKQPHMQKKWDKITPQSCDPARGYEYREVPHKGCWITADRKQLLRRVLARAKQYRAEGNDPSTAMRRAWEAEYPKASRPPPKQRR